MIDTYVDIDSEFFKQVIATQVMNVTPKKPLTLSKAFGITIRNLRHEHKMSLRTLSSQVHIALGHLSDIERGIKNMFLDDYERIAKVFDLDTQEFFDEVIKAQQGKVVGK